MKTTLDIPDELFREAKIKAAREGVKFKDLVAEGLQLLISGKKKNQKTKRTRFPIIFGKPGSKTLTDEKIAEAEEAALKEEAQKYAKLMRR